MNFLADIYYPHLKKYLFNRLHSVLVVARGIFCCGVWDLVSWPVIKPRSLHWEHRVLATRPPGKSQITLLSVRRFILGRKDMTNLSSVQFSRSVRSDPLQPHELQHARPPCPSQLPEFTQIHFHRISDAIQLSHPLSSPSPPALNPSQHQSLFQWVNSLHEVAKVLEFQL